jgi:hypothetical protein
MRTLRAPSLTQENDGLCTCGLAATSLMHVCLTDLRYKYIIHPQAVKNVQK